MFRKILVLSSFLALPLFGEPVKLEDLGTQISGKPQITEADLEDKLLVVHHWEAHCGRCKTALPAFEKEMRGKKKYATSVILHRHDKEELAKSVADDLRLKMPVFHGSKKLPQFERKGWPCIAIILPTGEVVYNGSPGKNFEKALRAAKKELK